MIHKTTRSILSVLLAALLLVTSVPLTPAFAGGGGAVSPQSESGESEGLTGSGTKDDPYKIATADDLLEFADKVNNQNKASAWAELTDDIDLSSVCGPELNDGTSWEPIGNSINQYRGTFDGTGHTISGLYINSSSDNYQGLFGYVSGTVQNLSVSGSVSGNNFVGGVVGLNRGSVEDCDFTGSVSGNNYVGGVVGYSSGGSSASASVTNCYNTGSVSGNSVGGVVGLNSSGIVTNCYNTGTVSSNSNISDVGGVVGWNDRGIVTNCYNIGEVSGNQVGGVVGLNNGNVTGCYFLTGTAEKGIGSGNPSAENVKSLTADEFAIQSSFTNSSWDFDNTWEIKSIFGRPTLQANAEIGGTANNPYKIFTATQLAAFRDLVNDENDQTADPDAHAKLMNDINLSEICGENVDGQSVSWTPIGSDSRPYSGTFNGDGHIISGLYINSSTADDQGLFGRVNGGTVKDLTVSGSVKGDDYVGGVVGYNSGGTVTGCIFSGSGNVSGDLYVGGVVGYNNGGTVTGCIFSGSGSGSVSGYSNAVGGVVGWNDSGANVENCYNTGSVNVIGNSSAVGGVVGCNQSGSSVTNCYNTGSVTSSDSPVGGVVGWNSGNVTNCYNTDSVSGLDSVGGVVGDNRGTVENCYNTGNVSGGSKGGGVVGNNSGIGSVTNCYFLQTDDVNVGRPGIGGGSGISRNVEARTADEFRSGEVAYLLQGTQTTPVWGQSNLTATTSLPTLVALNPDAAQPVYKVTFKYGYEGAPEEKISYSNGSVKFPAFERTGYTFAGWTPTGTTISQDTTFTAQWTANTYTVTLDPNDGTIAEDQNVTTYTYGIGATLPTTVTREGYTFAGWYEKEDLTGDPVIEISATDTGEKEYWAKWTPNTYTVTLHTNDGTIAEGQNISSYTYGIGATRPTSVTREGYTFAGWYEKEDFTGDPVAAIGKDAMGDKTYWAKWEEVENPEPEPTPTPTPDPTPSGPSTGDSTGWDDIRDELENTAKGEQITIDMGDETKVPAEIFESLAGKDVDVTFDLGDIQWSVNGADIPTDTDFTDLDLGASLDTHGIPVNVINTITGEVGTVQITLAHDGEFGFTMTLTAPLGKENAGYWANLYHYDEDAEALNFEAAAEIDADGSVTIPFSHASQYAIVIDTHSHAAVDVSDLFIDIARDAWYKDAVQYAYDNGLMTGVSATEFAPEATTTRAMIVSILARLENVTTAQATGFADVDDEWYATAVNWAANVGVVNGYEDNTFRPNTAITREQLAAILMNYAAYKGEDVSNRASLATYTDQPSTWAEEAMSWAVAEGLISGVTADTLQPQGAATRAQVAAILQRFLSE